MTPPPVGPTPSSTCVFCLGSHTAVGRLVVGLDVQRRPLPPYLVCITVRMDIPRTVTDAGGPTLILRCGCALTAYGTAFLLVGWDAYAHVLTPHLAHLPDRSVGHTGPFRLAVQNTTALLALHLHIAG